MNTDLRLYQVEGLDRLRASLASQPEPRHYRPMMMAPTGAGKTKIAAAIVEGALAKGNRVLFTVPAISLIDQTASSFYDEGIRGIGVIQRDHPMTDPSQPVQIASVQTLMKRQMPDVDVAIIDEAHKWFKFYEDWFADPLWQAKPIIGLSATPWTKGLGKHFDDLIIVSTTRELIDLGHLSKFRVFAPSHPDLSKVHIVAGDYHEGELSEAMQEGKLVADVVTTWLEQAQGRPTFCFAVDRAHAAALKDKFAASGVTAEYMDAFTELEERERIRGRFHRGETKVVCNVGVLTTGIDWDVRCLILARPTRSEMLFVQIIGRGLRTADGKEDCLILDHSDNHLRLGFVTDIHHVTLDDGRKKEGVTPEHKEPLPKECPKCHALRPPRTPVCPACGFKAEPVSKTQTIDGRLFEIKPEPKPAKPLPGGADQKSFYLQLVTIGAERGYKNGWASNQFKNKVGKWPERDWFGSVQPTPEVRSWVTSQTIRYAKGRAA
jgi:DNA repair protein RadD